MMTRQKYLHTFRAELFGGGTGGRMVLALLGREFELPSGLSLSLGLSLAGDGRGDGDGVGDGVGVGDGGQGDARDLFIVVTYRFDGGRAASGLAPHEPQEIDIVGVDVEGPDFGGAAYLLLDVKSGGGVSLCDAVVEEISRGGPHLLTA